MLKTIRDFLKNKRNNAKVGDNKPLLGENTPRSGDPKANFGNQNITDALENFPPNQPVPRKSFESALTDNLSPTTQTEKDNEHNEQWVEFENDRNFFQAQEPISKSLEKAGNKLLPEIKPSDLIQNYQKSDTPSSSQEQSPYAVSPAPSEKTNVDKKVERTAAALELEANKDPEPLTEKQIAKAKEIHAKARKKINAEDTDRKKWAKDKEEFNEENISTLSASPFDPATLNKETRNFLEEKYPELLISYKGNLNSPDDPEAQEPSQEMTLKDYLENLQKRKQQAGISSGTDKNPFEETLQDWLIQAAGKQKCSNDEKERNKEHIKEVCGDLRSVQRRFKANPTEDFEEQRTNLINTLKSYAEEFNLSSDEFKERVTEELLSPKPNNKSHKDNGTSSVSSGSQETSFANKVGSETLGRGEGRTI